jgi:hypothetical protein
VCIEGAEVEVVHVVVVIVEEVPKDQSSSSFGA